MADADQLLGMYLHLARASKMRQQPLVRAKLLVLAGAQAQEMGLDDISALCRYRVLAQNPRHLVRRWSTLREALSAEPFQTHLKQLRRRYSREKIEHMMQSLGIEMAQERAAYFSDSEYAAALLNVRVEAIDDLLAKDPVRESRDSRGEEKNEDSSRGLAPIHRLLLLWGPFVCGVVILLVLALWSRNV